MPIQELSRRTELAKMTTWLREAKTGNQAAAQKLFDCYARRIGRGIARYLPLPIRPRIDVEDLMQEARVVLLRKSIPAWIETPRDFARYLAQVARRETLAAIRNHLAAKCRSVQREVSDPITDDREPIANTPSIPDICAQNELWDILIIDAPASFKPYLRLLRQGNSLRQIARKTGMDENLVLDIILASLKSFRGAKENITKESALRLFVDGGCPVQHSLMEHYQAWMSSGGEEPLHVVEGINQSMTRRQRKAFEKMPPESKWIEAEESGLDLPDIPV